MDLKLCISIRSIMLQSFYRIKAVPVAKLAILFGYQVVWSDIGSEAGAESGVDADEVAFEGGELGGAA